MAPNRLRRTRRLIALGSVLAAAGFLPRDGGAALAVQHDAWADIARADLEAIRTTLEDNHPGPVDPRNPGYRRWLESGYDSARVLASRATSLDHVLAAISFYTSGFEDGHLGWGSFYERRVVRWPGFVVGHRGGRFIVTQRADWSTVDLPPDGAEVVRCDGESLERHLTERVMRFREGLPSVEASKVRIAPHVLIDDSNPWLPPFASCVFVVDEEERTLELEWRQIARAELEPAVANAAYGPPPDTYSVDRPAPGIAWIRIPSLAENAGDNEEGLLRIVEELPSVRDADLIVFDVRGNRGGSSSWTPRILDPLFGGAYVSALRRRVNQGVDVQWRASSGNADFIENFSLPRHPPDSRFHDHFVDLIATLRGAAGEGRDLTGDASPSDAASQRAAVEPHPVGPRTILFTDGWCASACLDFADVVLSIPGARHAGAATYADALYIDNRSIRLPSGLGLFGFSMKVYRNRLRDHNEAYEPDLVYQGTDWSTEAVQEWLLMTLGESGQDGERVGTADPPRGPGRLRP